MDIENKDVIVDSSSTSEETKVVEAEESKEINNKDKNFAELRKKAKELEEANKELRAKLEGDRSLEINSKEDKKNDPLRIVFERDLKDITREWNKKNSISSEEWAELKKRVTFNGDETRGEIHDKITEAYEALPTTKVKKEKELIEKGKRLAMKQFQDNELDIGSGGDVDLGGGGETPRFTAKEQHFLKVFGVSKEEQAKIDKSSNSYQDWTILDPKYK